MITFKEFMQESSLTRLKSKSDKGGMAVLSGSRGDKSAKENRARAKQLDKDIRGKGLPGATKVTGRYVEKGDDGKEKKVKERSHVVTSGKMGKRKFKKAVKALGKKYGQDAVITQTKGGGGCYTKENPQGWITEEKYTNRKNESRVELAKWTLVSRGRLLLMNKKPYDDSNWREEYKSYTSNKRYIELLENGPKSLSQSWLLGALYNEWKQIKGYNKLDPKENEGQLQSSLKEFLNHQKDQGI